jgi:anti-sigma factor RsiW
MSAVTWPEKSVAGLSCSQVLERLSDYLDGDLAEGPRAALEAHVKGCDGCARFGGEMVGTVRALRRHLLGASPPPGLLARLLSAIDREPGQG